MSMFDHLSADLAVDSKSTKPYTFSELLTQPTCHFRPATEDNKDYAAALLKLSSKKARKNRSSSRTTTVKSIKALRQQNQLLVARYCLVGWDENMTDTKGKPIEFNSTRALKFLQSIPHWIFDRLMAWLNDPDNFVMGLDEDENEDGGLTMDDLIELENEDQDEDVEEGQTLGKSSQPS